MYPSSEYRLAFHPSSPLNFVILEESNTDTILLLFSLLGINVNVPFPDDPRSPVAPATPSAPCDPVEPIDP